MVEGELTTFIDADKNKNTFFMLMEAISSIEDGNVLDSRIFSTPKEVESPVKMYEPPGKKRNSVSKEDSAVQNFLSGTSSS